MQLCVIQLRWVNVLTMWRKHKNIFPFSIICGPWNSTGNKRNWSHPSRKKNLFDLSSHYHGGSWPGRSHGIGSLGSHYNDVIMRTIASQITSLTIVYSIVYSDADQRKHQSSASLAFVRGIHRGPVNSPHKWPVTRKMLPFDDVIMDRVLSEYFAFNTRRAVNVHCRLKWW